MENENQQLNTEKPKKKVFSVILNVLTWVLLGISLVVMVFTIISSTMFNKSDKKLFGVSMMIVLSDSMKKTDFDAGDLIFIQKVDPNTLKEGDIICFNTTKDGKEVVVTHKIRRKTYLTEQIKNSETGLMETVYIPAFVTYGTTTGTDDEDPVTYEFINGKYVGKLPYVGHVFNFLKTPAGYICIVLVPFVLLIGFALYNLISSIVAYRKENMSAYRAEKAGLEQERQNLESERAENIKMLEEMRRLKEELEAMKNSQNTAQPKQEEPTTKVDVFEDKQE
jgi:signal peptidase